MASSLDSLMNNFIGCTHCGWRKLIGYEEYTDNQYDLHTRKRIYPYEYVSSWDHFKEVQLPPIEAFYSNLNMSNISEDDY